MSALGDDPQVHFIRDGRFVCVAEATADCHNYPACECDQWDMELHGHLPGSTPEPGHENVPHDECWIVPWVEASSLADSYEDGDGYSDDQFPDGPVTTSWECDYVLWSYADDTQPMEAAS